MQLNANDYRSAALEHLARAQRAYEAAEYIVAHYYSGVAVECMLRGRQCVLKTASQRKDGWYSRHDILRLAKDAHFWDWVPGDSHAEWDARLSELNLRWSSENRYCSEQALRRYLVKAGLNLRKRQHGRLEYVRGNLIKHNADRVLGLAQDIVALGEAKWK